MTTRNVHDRATFGVSGCLSPDKGVNAHDGAEVVDSSKSPFWQGVERAAKSAESWPKWKQHGLAVADNIEMGKR